MPLLIALTMSLASAHAYVQEYKGKPMTIEQAEDFCITDEALDSSDDKLYDACRTLTESN